MQRVIGLDIGSYSIKAVEIVNSFKSYEIANFYEKLIPDTEDAPLDTIVPQCMEQLFSENNLEADRIVTAMPGQFISSRVMSFGFSDPRKIHTAILSEVEDEVPFSMDDMIVDHQILGALGDKTIALVVMTRKAFLKSFLELLQRIKIDPKLIDVDSLSFYNLSAYMPADPNEVYGLVDVGHEKTSVCFVQDGMLRMFRTINLGGRYLSEFLARDLETSFSEAQKVKHRVSRILCSTDQGEDLVGDDKIIVERMTLASNAIIKELGRTLYAFKTWEKTPVSRLILSGGTARILNFDRFLEDQLEVQVERNHLNATQLKINQDLDPHMDIMPQSVAIGIRAISSVKRLSSINLRRGEFAYVQDYGMILKAVSRVGKLFGAATVMLVVSYCLMYFFYKGQIDSLQSRYVKEYIALFPEQKNKYPGKLPFTKIRQETKNSMQKEIDTKRLAVERFLAENSGSGPLLVLKAISDKMPKTVKVDVTQFQYSATADGNGKIVLRGETDAYASVSTILQALKGIGILKDVEEKASGGKPGTENKVIEFTIHATYAGAAKADGSA